MADITHGCCGSSESDAKDIKTHVKQEYGRLAAEAAGGRQTSCCASSACKDAVTRDLYSEAETPGIP
ncbi:MAG: hypothetical protein ACP5R5_02210, partial [Armatimonadota bacterium]